MCYFQGLYKAALLIASIMGVVLLSFTAETLYNNISSAPAAFQGLIPMFRGEIIYIAFKPLGSPCKSMHCIGYIDIYPLIT